MEWPQLREEIGQATARVGALLRAAPDGSVPVRGLEWSVGELGAHLVTVPRRYLRMMREPVPFPSRLSEMNAAENEAVGSTDPMQLADILESEVAELLDVLGDDGGRAVPFFGMQHTVAGVAGVLLGELLVHGLDLARTLGRPWSLEKEQALAITSGLLPSMPYSADAEVARRAGGTYHLRLRGGDHWTFVVRDGEVAISRGRPARPDLHVSADPVAFLLVGYERMARWKALLRGQMIGWGRKPWLAGRFGRLFVET